MNELPAPGSWWRSKTRHSFKVEVVAVDPPRNGYAFVVVRCKDDKGLNYPYSSNYFSKAFELME